jgi:hypothetical protein
MTSAGGNTSPGSGGTNHAGVEAQQDDAQNADSKRVEDGLAIPDVPDNSEAPAIR